MVLAAATVVVVALVAAAAFLLQSTPRGAGARTPPSALQRTEAANRKLAATWVSQQLNPGEIVACDAAMCSALEAAGYPSANVRTLGPSSPDPLSSDVVVDTPTVRGFFGSSLGLRVAPKVLATVGSGAAAVQVRIIAPHGPAAYQQQLASDLSTRKQTGAALLASGQFSTQPAARKQLADGLVDTRLLYVITVLAGFQPIDIVGFGTVATGASHDLPLRYTDLTETAKSAHLSSSAYVSALLKILASLPAPYRPLRTQTAELTPGKRVLRIEFGAPSPLGLPAFSSQQ